MKTTSVEIRKTLELVELLKSNGILFVPMPVLNTEDQEKLKKRITSPAKLDN